METAGNYMFPAIINLRIPTRLRLCRRAVDSPIRYFLSRFFVDSLRVVILKSAKIRKAHGAKGKGGVSQERKQPKLISFTRDIPTIIIRQSACKEAHASFVTMNYIPCSPSFRTF